MASRAEAVAPASIGSAIRQAGSDLYYHSWRLVPANVVWAVVAVALAVAVTAVPPLIVLTPLLALPTAGLFRMSALIARGRSVSFWDGIAAWRDGWRPALALGALVGVAGLVGLSDLAAGLASGTMVGWTLATLAFWGLAVLWALAWTVWPLLADPARGDRPIAVRLRTAAMLLLADPWRTIGMSVVLLLLTVVSAFLIVTLVTIWLAFTALVATRCVLPAADRLDARLGRPVSPGEGAPAGATLGS